MKTNLVRSMFVVSFAATALLAGPAFAGGPGSRMLGAELPASLRDTLGFQAPSVEERSLPSSLGDSDVATPAESLVGDGAKATAIAASAARLVGDATRASASVAGDVAASPSFGDVGEGASALGGSVADALAGMNGGSATVMVGDGIGGSPFSGSSSMSMSRPAGIGGLMTMSSWSTSW